MSYGILMSVIGLLLCFFGMRLNKLAAFLVGFAAGSYLAYLVLTQYILKAGENPTYVHLIIVLAAGLVGSGAAYKFEKLAVFLGAFLAAGYLVYQGTIVISSVDAGSLPAAAICGFIVAAVIYLFYDTMVILATSLIGAILASGGLWNILLESGKLPDLTSNELAYPVLAIVLLFAGILVQKKNQ